MLLLAPGSGSRDWRHWQLLVGHWALHTLTCTPLIAQGMGCTISIRGLSFIYALWMKGCGSLKVYRVLVSEWTCSMGICFGSSTFLSLGGTVHFENFFPLPLQKIGEKNDWHFHTAAEQSLHCTTFYLICVKAQCTFMALPVILQ